MEPLILDIFLRLVLKILLIEFIIIGFLTVGIVILKIFYKQKDIKEKKIKNGISKIIQEALLQNAHGEVKLSRQLRNFKILIETVESFNCRITDTLWEKIKESILENYLLKKARKNVKSFFWIKRQLAARCFLLYPSKAREEDISLLLKDPKFLVRFAAAFCATKMPYRNLFYEMIKIMSTEKSLARFSYRDALLQVDAEKYRWIEELLTTKPSPEEAAICLDLLSERVTHSVIPLIIPYIYGQDQQCRLLAIKALKNFSSEESVEILLHCLTDQSWEMRSESLKILSSWHVIKAIPKVKPLLQDPVWFVRLQAALALKNMGSEGLKILSNQDLATQPLAYEISQYVMSL